MFAKETYVQRRAVLKAQVKTGLILLLGNEESSINFKDNWYTFRQDSTFLYYLGLSHPGFFALLDCESGEEMVFGNDLTIDDIVWTGPQPTVADLASITGITKTAPVSGIEGLIKGALAAGREVHVLPPYRPEHLLQLAEFTGWPLASIRSKASEKLIRAVVAQRNIKSAEEIAEIDKATTITGEMHLAAMRVARAGMKEFEIAKALHEVAIGGGGNLAFPIILTKDGQTLHNHYHGNTVQEGDMVLVDAGAETVMGYCGDMTRTFPVSKAFTPRQAELYSIVLKAHKTAVKALKPGIPFKEIHLLACRTLFDGLKEVGLAKGNTDEAVTAGAHAMFFQCGLGHMMGMDVHDMENLGEQFVGYTEPKSTQFGLKSLRLGRPLETGFVVTVEPGIYIIPELIDMWKAENKFTDFLNYDMLEQYKDFGGIRVEEDYAITSSVAQLLGKPVALTIEEVEAQRA